MLIPFSKYHGTGNDFILIDNRQLRLDLTPRITAHWCDRHFGIGADGIILIQDHPEYDFEMVYYNSDGSKSMCGNGSRCAVRFAESLGVITEKTTFLSTDGVHHAYIRPDEIQLSLFDVKEITETPEHFFINTGSPHHIEITDDVEKIDVLAVGKEIREAKTYAPNGTNVNFMQLEANNTIIVRTYERGVEGETLSCGTGVTACALAAATKGYKSPVHIQTRGGILSVSFEREASTFNKIYLTGPAVSVFAGNIEYNPPL